MENQESRMKKAVPTMVSGMRFMMALEAAGVLQKADHTRRVVIDCVFNEPLMVYVENVGDERILDVVTHPDLKVAIVRRDEDGGG